MKIRFLVASLVAIAPTGGAFAEEGSTREGRAILAENCGGCHALAVEAASPNPDAPPFREVMRRYPAADLEESLAEGIVTGHPDMPEVSFGPMEVADVIAYLDALAVVTGEAP